VDLSALSRAPQWGGVREVWDGASQGDALKGEEKGMGTSTAMTRFEGNLPAHPLAKVEEVRNTFKALEGKVNLISPVASVDTIPAMHGISLRAVSIDPETNQYGNGPEVYKDARFCEGNERALGGVALQKIAAAAGVQIIDRRRLDDRSDPNYCEMEITIGMRDFDGTQRQVIKGKEMDLRDGAPETLKPEKDGNGRKTGKMVPYEASALADKRRHIQSHAETKAFYRALRTILSIKQKYTLKELALPFVVPKLVPALDPNDPDQKRALIGMAVGGEAALFGQRRQLEAGAAPPADVRMLKDVTPAATNGDAAPAPKGANTADAEDIGEGDDADDFELPDQLNETDSPARFVCECPCGDQVALTEEVAKVTKERVGAARCKSCYPGAGFDFAKHKDLRTLGLPAFPKLDAEGLRQKLEQKPNKRAARDGVEEASS
jgi:hypothetical protein